MRERIKYDSFIWTKERQEIAIKLHTEHQSNEQISVVLGCHPHQVRYIVWRYRHGSLPVLHRWTKDETETLRSLLEQKFIVPDIAKKMGKIEGHIWQKIRSLKIDYHAKKNFTTKAQDLAKILLDARKGQKLVNERHVRLTINEAYNKGFTEETLKEAFAILQENNVKIWKMNTGNLCFNFSEC